MKNKIKISNTQIIFVKKGGIIIDKIKSPSSPTHTPVPHRNICVTCFFTQLHAVESYPGWRRPTIPFNSNHHIHSLSVHVISHSSIHDSVFPVSPYEELCNGHACTCFLVHKCQCFSKVETNIWNGWLTAYVYFYFIQYCQISLFNMALSVLYSH